MYDSKITNKLKDKASLIYAPLTGTIVSLEQIEDPMIAARALGDGVAINPTNNVVVSPCNGVIKLVHSHKHVVIIETTEGVDILIHVGVNTKSVAEEQFEAFVKVKDTVKVGDKLLAFNKEELIAQGKSPVTVVIANYLDTSINAIKFSDKSQVEAGTSLIYAVGEKNLINSSSFSNYFNGINSNTNNNNLSPMNTQNERLVTQEVTIYNETGLHARPAAFLCNLVKKLPASITLTKGEDSANAKSLIEILGLGINFNDQVVITVEGENATQILSQIVEAFNNGLGEEITSIPQFLSDNKISSENASIDSYNEDCTPTREDLVRKINNKEASIAVKGICIYPSLVSGKAYIVKSEKINFAETSKLSVSEEDKRLQNALQVVHDKIEEYINEAKEQNKLSQVEIFSAHLEVLSDSFLLKHANEQVQQGKTAEFAFSSAVKKTCDVLNQTQNTLLKERTADIKDIGKGVLTVLSGKPITSLQIPEDSIVIAEDLTPSNITSFNNNVKGVVLAKGSSTSHISIMMKNDGVPSIVSMGSEILNIPAGSRLILDSKNSCLIINPSEEQVKQTKEAMVKQSNIKSFNLTNCKEDAITTDGVKIKVLGNVGGIDQAVKTFDRGGEGIGLVRSEFLFMNTTSAPSEDEQHRTYQAICDAMHGYEVVVRTLDVGGDKPISYIKLPSEDNPIMGLRGVRNYYLNKDIFYSQIKALLRVNPTGVCKIMLPMVSGIDEVIKVKTEIAEAQKALGIKNKVQVGIMVEVPSVALLAKQFAKHVDFFSIGTNDLAQYMLAMDRGHDILTKHLNNLNPALLKAIVYTCEGAKEVGIPVGICGAMASEPESVPILIGLGVSSLSCSAEIIPDIKALIRKISFAKCKEIAYQALTLENQDQVKELIIKEFGEYL